MALSSTIVWEVRTGGVDTNGGGFKTGASGTDWSQQNAAQYSVTDAVTNGTTTITSATASFGTDVVGNVLYITGGSGSIVAARYEIVSRTNATTIVVDRSTGLSAGTGATLIIGGALLTLATLEGSNVGGNKAWIQSGTYSLTSTLTLTASASPDGTALIVWRGYQTSRGDNTGTRPTITSSTNSLALIDTGSSIRGRVFRNMKFTHTAATRGIGLAASTSSATFVQIADCEFDGLLGAIKFDNLGAQYAGSATIRNCRFVNCTGSSASSAAIAICGGSIESCIIKSNGGHGILLGQDGSGSQHLFVRNTIISSNNSRGISTDYMTLGGLAVEILSSTTTLVMGSVHTQQLVHS